MEAHTNHASKEDTNMTDMAGLMALMQNNKGASLPEMMALCNKNGFGGSGNELFFILFLFLVLGGGWNGLSGANREAFTAAAGTETQTITGIYDRIYAAQAETAQGFSNLNTYLCDVTSRLMGVVRDQGDRSVAATNDVSRQLSDCCCTINRSIDGVLCAVREGIAQTKLSESNLMNRMNTLEATVSLEAERTRCLIKDTAKDERIQYLEDKLHQSQHRAQAVSNTLLAKEAATESVSQLQNFIVNHYTPTVK